MTIETKKYNGYPSNVDVPVKINIWSREKCQKAQFEVIKKARPSVLFIQSDGGRTKQEMELIAKNREYVLNEIDWECDVHIIFEDVNVGLYEMGKRSKTYIWQNVDYCIFFEDDQIPSLSAFGFCKAILERYKNDDRIQAICLFNILGENKKCDHDYFFTRQGMIWAYATWKRAEALHNDFSYYESSSLLKNINYAYYGSIDHKIIKSLNYSGKNRTVKRPYSNHEFWTQSNAYLQNQLIIVPAVNMISCYGDISGSNASRLGDMPRFRRKLFHTKSFEINLENIRMQSFVIPDEKYSKKFTKTIISERKIFFFFWNLFLKIKHFFRLCFKRK